MGMHSKREWFEWRPPAEQTGYVDVDILTFRFNRGFRRIQQVKAGQTRLRLRRHRQSDAAEVRRRKGFVVMNLQDEEVDLGGAAEAKADAGRKMKLLRFGRPGIKDLGGTAASGENTSAIPIAGRRGGEMKMKE